MTVEGTRRGGLAALAMLLIASMMALLPAAQPAAQAAPPDGPDKLADFEGGVPAGWFTFAGGSTVNTTTQVVADGDPLALPNQAGDNELLLNDFNVTDFGGFGQDLATALGGPQDWSQTEAFSFWFYGTGSGLGYQAEISDNRSDPNIDTSERFDYTFTDSTAGWQYISIPWGEFTRATDFQPGGAPDDGFTLTEIYAWAIVLPLGLDAVYFDDFALDNVTIDDFESGLPVGVDGDGVSIGFYTFQGAGSSVGITTAATPPAPALPPAAGPDAGNEVLQIDLDVSSFAGFIHGFENATVDTWVPQDWSASGGMALWLYGNNSGTDMFFDLLENRNPGSTTDDAERWTVTLNDDFSGWRYFEIPFAGFVRKGIGNGAPDDGLTLAEVHGWAFGTLGTGGPVTYYLDDVKLYGVAEIPELAVQFATPNFDIEEGATGGITVKLNRSLGSEDPAQVSVDYSVETLIAQQDRDFVQPADGTLTFVNGGPTEQSFSIETIDDSKYEPTERLILRLSNPVDVAPGATLQAAANIIDNDPFDPLLLDDFERFPHLWATTGDVTLANPEVAVGDPLTVPGQGAYERVLEATVPLHVDIAVEGRVCNTGSGVIPVVLYSTAGFDATTVDHTTVTLGAAGEAHVDKKTGIARRHEQDFDGDGDLDLVFHFRFADTGLPCDAAVVPFNGRTYDGQPITGGGSDAGWRRDFPIGQDWSDAESLSFWYYGQNTGDTITVDLLDNRAADPGPSGWSLAWADEFNDPAGTPPNPANWGYELGDGIVNGIPGWGNSELQYYTDSPDNAATDGAGNLVITAAEADGELCYYGECEFTSARLVTTNRAEFAYGRIESRILVPDGGNGLWPAFWSLGTDIDLVDWPQTGEIDIMEYVSRIPDEIFGTIHGPGYSGGNAFGNTFPFPGGVSADYHTFAIEWQPDLIEWYVDGVLYHTATPDDVAPNEWVFNDPVYLLLNLAIGGNFGGPLAGDLTFPQELAIDYVRVYQGPDTAERFESTFVDDFDGWQQVVVPFDSFVRSAEQPAGAPDDGLGLAEVWGYGFDLADEGSSFGTLWLDQVHLVPIPPPTEIVVTNLNDSGAGSLRQAIEDIAIGGTITFDPGLAGGTLALTTGPIVIGKDVAVDAADTPGISMNGGGIDRVLIVNAGANATFSELTMTNGFGYQLAGCVLNNGDLTLDHVTVAGCLMTTDAGDFWQGGGGIYNGDGAALLLVDSTVADNTAQWSGGGVYSFFNTTTVIERSTISGNVSNDVGGGLRSLGNATITNSTISGNESTGWYGGAAFITDGVVDMTNVTVANNIAPGFAPAALFVGTFTDASATLNLTNTVIADNVTEGCFLAPFGGGAVAINSLGSNVFDDATCSPIASDHVVGAAGLGPLADNGGPTPTHALQAGSPAIDAADTAVCPAIDQRGVARDAACDVGSFEYVP